MTDRVIPINDGRRTKPFPPKGKSGGSERSGQDRLGRRLHDLRISVTDRCNFRCIYCMPRDVFGPDYAFLPKSELLSFEEIARLARVFKGHGVEKIRLTGGEPLLRRNLERLIEMLADIPGLDLTLTTNGSVLAKKARALKAAGLTRVTVSLDSLDEAVEPNDTGEVAERWRYRDGSGEIGVISSVTQAFCRTCTRARLSTEGMLYTCLFATAGYDLRGLLRGGSSAEEISDAIARIWQ